MISGYLERKRGENLKASFNAIFVLVCKNVGSEIFYFERKYFAFVPSRDKRNFSHFAQAAAYIPDRIFKWIAQSVYLAKNNREI